MYGANEPDQYAKSGFLSRNDQYEIIHNALLTNEAQNAMKFLVDPKKNCQSFDHITMQSSKNDEIIQVSILASSFPPNFDLSSYQFDKWSQNGREGVQPINGVFMILQHQKGQKNDRNAYPHILTCYPY